MVFGEACESLKVGGWQNLWRAVNTSCVEMSLRQIKFEFDMDRPCRIMRRTENESIIVYVRTTILPPAVFASITLCASTISSN